MQKFSTHLVVAIALLSISAPAFARHDHHDGRGHGRGYSNKHYRKYVKNRNQVNKKIARWEWGKHSWNQRRDYLRNNWRNRSAQVSAAQRAQVDAQLRAQWLAYHNNNWNGAYDWNQYSDPAFLDYMNNRNPSLLDQIRRMFGIF
ncbi:MAG: hypothetical protein K2X93_26135 [Candidatus Obscuribacterales bacterium]|nr:hypothetical protein [Candidatus Obscuribacterales bacterium]